MLEVTLCRRLDEDGLDIMTEGLLLEEEAEAGAPAGEPVRLWVALAFVSRPTVGRYVSWMSGGVPALVELDARKPPEGGLARLRSMRADGSASGLVSALSGRLADPSVQLPLSHGFHGGGGWLFQAAWESLGRPGVRLHPFSRRDRGGAGA